MCIYYSVIQCTIYGIYTLYYNDLIYILLIPTITVNIIKLLVNL